MRARALGEGNGVLFLFCFFHFIFPLFSPENKLKVDEGRPVGVKEGTEIDMSVIDMVFTGMQKSGL